MKTDDPIPLPKKEDLAASQVRREDYALARDKQALEFNDAIAKRILHEKLNITKCNVCGKEFPAGSSETHNCPDCAPPAK